MPLHVKVMPEIRLGQCPKCLSGPPHHFVLHITAGGGMESTEPSCITCLLNGGEQTVLIEQPELSPGRQPPSKRLVKRTRKEEHELARDAGGRRQKGSGNLPWAKGDGVLKGIARWDSKMCFSKKVSWTLDDLVKIRSEADYGEVPAIITAFADRTTHQVQERWATIPYEVYQERIIHAAQHHQ